MKQLKAVVCGAGGFIGAHLVERLKAEGHWVRGVDVKPPEFGATSADEFLILDLRKPDGCFEALATPGGVDEVYQLAADMGGMGFIEHNKALCMLSVLINTNALLAAHAIGVGRYFFASSACVYAADKQDSADVAPLREEDAYPAMPEDGYGWEKLFSERMCRHFREDFSLETRIGRYHNVYGPLGTYSGGREKAPAAICRKIAEAKLSGRHEIEIWGDGSQTRSFTYIDDCVHGTRLLMESGFVEPLNIGSSELVSVNGLVDVVESIAGIQVKRTYNLHAPQGVRGRNSDNTRIREALDWEPTTPLVEGLEKTYAWILQELRQSRGAR